jgi:hypothetical protein
MNKDALSPEKSHKYSSGVMRCRLMCRKVVKLGDALKLGVTPMCAR